MGLTMSSQIVVSMAQLDLTAGDLAGNRKKIIEAIEKSREADILVTPELSLSGYPPEDLLFLPNFINDCKNSLDELVSMSTKWPRLHILVGLPLAEEGSLYNAVCVIKNGEVIARYRKQKLPNYGVFDEARYFDAASNEASVFWVGETCFGINICEDVWFSEPPMLAKKAGAQILLIPNASPYEVDKNAKRLRAIRDNVLSIGLEAVYVNVVGGQDEIVFDGLSFACSDQGRLIAAKAFEEDVTFVHFNGKQLSPDQGSSAETFGDIQNLYRALVISLRDYVYKNGFDGVVLGLSGGVDSALCLKTSVDALGADKVLAVMMPSVFTSSLSREDAQKLSDRLGVRLITISIQEAYSAFENMLSDEFDGLPKDVTEENLQARIRGMILMALSNKFGRLVVTTGNKSEMAVGYSTLYGDLAGGFAILKDIYKTTVYKLCNWLNSQSREPVFPETVLTRAPSAELRENQKDEDSLPPYDVLDRILKLHIEGRKDEKEIVSEGFEPDVVKKVLALVHKAEYKRRQAPIGPKVTSVAFGRDWRFPVTNRYNC